MRVLGGMPAKQARLVVSGGDVGAGSCRARAVGFTGSGACAGGWHERVVAHGYVTRVQLAFGAEGGHSRHFAGVVVERCYRFGHVP